MAVYPRPRGRSDGGTRRASAGHGVRHRIGRASTGRPLHRCCRRLSDFGAGRIAAADRRSDRSVCGHRRRDRREVRHLRAGVSDHPRRSSAPDHGPDRPGDSRKVHPSAGDHRLHERHRRADRLDADQGFPWAHDTAGSERVLCAHARADRSSGNGALADGRNRGSVAGHHSAVAEDHEADSGLDPGVVCGDAGRRSFSPAGGDHRQQIRRYSARLSAFRNAAVSFRAHSPAAALGVYRCDAGRRREPALRRCCRRHERRSPQLERRAGRPGHRQHCLAALRRHSRDWSHRAHRNQHPLRARRRRSRAWCTR